MKRYWFILLILVFSTSSCSDSSITEDPMLNTYENKKTTKTDCVSIQDGVLTYKTGHYLAGKPFSTGFDMFGYNYESHQFKGSYANLYLGEAGFPPYEGDSVTYLSENPDVLKNAYIMTYYWPYRDAHVLMNWNDARWSNKDCDDDGEFDRHLGFDTYQGSGAWETFHTKGTYTDSEGNECRYNIQYKYVAPPSDAVLNNGIWYTPAGEEIGKQFYYLVEVQRIVNDPCGGFQGLQYKSPLGPGKGKWN